MIGRRVVLAAGAGMASVGGVQFSGFLALAALDGGRELPEWLFYSVPILATMLVPILPMLLGLFPRGRTYAYTEWSDVFPEMVVDRGRWKPGPGILQLSPDAEFAHDRQNDSAFLILRPEADPGKLLLLGVDHHLPRFEQEPGDPRGWLAVCSLERKGPWADGEASRVRTRLATPRLFRIPEPIKLH